MSVVTNVIVSGMGGTYPKDEENKGAHHEAAMYSGTVIQKLNAYLADPDKEPGVPDSLGQLVEVSDLAGGTRNMETHVWIGGFNYLRIDEFLAVWWEAIAEFKKKNRGTPPQLFMSRQDDFKFYEMPNEDDGGSHHYRDAEQDKRPTYVIPTPAPLPPFAPCDRPVKEGDRCTRRKDHEGMCCVRKIHKAPEQLP